MASVGRGHYTPGQIHARLTSIVDDEVYVREFVRLHPNTPIRKMLKGLEASARERCSTELERREFWREARGMFEELYARVRAVRGHV